ncbi:MAG: 30S ribosomal protein S20 [Exiguobacterium marinum]|uniref:Small ribosomal subunit protein bS20 n=1 Tax=Exiguobacterium marinum TaxID=273528 RepID=A0ABY7WWI5_9BACL|nr:MULTISPECIES: 30S ribosomal protein S20 [Exiguobacterium]WDH74930.1 30S ribosomal protein S20 [Exiguobacterium marinum]
MANIKSAIKRAKTSEKRRVANSHEKAAMRTAVKRVDALVLEGNKEAAQEAFVLATKKLDKAASKGLIHKNKAGRDKSRLAARIAAL